MTYQEYSVHMRVCEFLGREPIGHFRKIHDFLTELWDGMEFVVEFGDRIILQKGGQWYFKQDGRNGYIWCECARVWSYFQKDMDMEDTVTQDFIKSVVEEHLKCEVGEPNDVLSPYGPFGQNVRGLYLKIMK